MGYAITERRTVGRTALALPVLGLGTAPLGELYQRMEEAQARATLEAAWAAGVRYFDTAPWYGRGLSEHRLGGFLRGMPRHDFLVTTKVGRTLHRPKDPHGLDRSPWTGGLSFEVTFDYTYDGIMRSYEQALQRLSLDTVEALLIHDLDAGYQGEALEARRRDLAESGLRALEDLKASGEIQAYGMGVNTLEALDTVAAAVEVDFLLVALPYTLLDQASLHTGMARCAARGIGVVIGAPFASGILVTGSGAGAKYAYGAAPEAVQARVRRMERVCAAHGVALPVAALQFPLAHPAVVSVIPGALRPAEVEANAAAIGQAIPTGFWSDLKGEGLIDPSAPTPTADPGRAMNGETGGPA